MKACRQRNADDFKRAQGRAGCRAAVRGGGLGQVQRLDARLTAQQRHHARLHIIFVRRFQHFGQWFFAVGLGGFARYLVAVVALHLAKPGNDVGVAARLQVADLPGGQGLGLQGGFHIAQCDRQQRRVARLCARLGKALQNAEGRRCKLGQRRHGTRRRLERKAVGIDQRPIGGVLEACGQFERERG